MCKCRYEGPEGTRLKMMQISRAVLTRQLCNLKPYRTFDSARIKQTQVHRASPSSNQQHGTPTPCFWNHWSPLNCAPDSAGAFFLFLLVMLLFVLPPVPLTPASHRRADLLPSLMNNDSATQREH